MLGAGPNGVELRGDRASGQAHRQALGGCPLFKDSDSAAAIDEVSLDAAMEFVSELAAKLGAWTELPVRGSKILHVIATRHHRPERPGSAQHQIRTLVLTSRLVPVPGFAVLADLADPSVKHRLHETASCHP